MIPITLDISVTTATGDPVTIYRTPAGRQQGATPIGEVVISFGRPSPRDHAEPGEVLLTIDQPANTDLVLDYDAEIIVTATLPGDPDPITLSRCWLQDWTRTHLPNNVDRYYITAHDVIGRAAAWYVGDVPWPQENQAARAARIAALAPGTIDTATFWWIQPVRARDVDNRPILELLALTCRPDSILTPTPTGISTHRPGHTLNYVPEAWSTVFVEESYPPPVLLPTTLIEDTGVALNQGSRINRVAIEHPDPADPEEETKTTVINGRADVTGPPATHALTTDIIDISSFLPMLRGILAGTDMLHPGQARTDVLTPQPSRLLLRHEQAPATVWRQLLDEETRLTTPVYLTGPMSRSDYPRQGFITAGTITADGHGVVAYDITFTPGEVAGIRRLRWRDWQRYYQRWRFLQLAHTLGPGSRMRFSHAQTVRFIDGPDL